MSHDEIGRYLVNKRLAMSRSIGDLELKEFGVTAEPTIVRNRIKHYKVRLGHYQRPRRHLYKSSDWDGKPKEHMEMIFAAIANL